jgi:Zn-dependent peptidase ImmA (M78 family)
MKNSSDLPPLTHELMLHFEHHAMEFRKRAGLNSLEPFMPFKHLTKFDVIVKHPDEFEQLPEELLAEVDAQNAKDWSAISEVLPNGKLFVIMNRKQTPERKNVTVLEEIAHEHFDHERTIIGPDGRKNYNPVQEREARFTAAASLLPAVIVAQTLYRKQDIQQVAAAYGASLELFEMRVKTMSLWKHYKHLTQEAA